MAQLDDLNATLSAISSDVDATLSKVKDLQDQLAKANANPGVDLSAAIKTADDIRAKLEGTAATASGAPSATPGA